MRDGINSGDPKTVPPPQTTPVSGRPDLKKQDNSVYIYGSKSGIRGDGGLGNLLDKPLSQDLLGVYGFPLSKETK